MRTTTYSYTTLTWFKGVGFDTPMEDIKKMYLKLAKTHHPDMGGTLDEMVKINGEYDWLKLHNFNVKKAKDGSTYTDEREERADDITDRFTEIIDILIKLDGILIEIIGSWMWVSGDTFPHKDAIKEAGGRWQKRKRAWYFAPEGFKPKRRAAVASLDEIRGAYGSKTVADNRGRKTEHLAIAS